MRRPGHRDRPAVRAGQSGVVSFHASASFAYATPTPASATVGSAPFSSIDFGHRRGALRETLSDRGIRLTEGRLAVLALFAPGEDPIDAEEAWRRLLLATPGASHSSLYRHIAFFVRKGLLVELAGRHRRRFALPDETPLRLVSDETQVDVDAIDLGRAIRTAALDAGLSVAGRRIVIHLEHDG